MSEAPGSMSQYFVIHPRDPQKRLIRQTVEILRGGGVIAYPTDSCYALGCQMGDKAAMERIRWIRDVDENHHFTLMCRDLTEIGHVARVDNTRFRLLKAATPGSYTFILEASRDLPRRILHPKRKTIGIRIPEHPVAQALLAELGEPLLSTTLILPGEDAPLDDAQVIRERLEKVVELIIDSGSCGTIPTTIVDLTRDAPEIIREGKGPVGPFLH